MSTHAKLCSICLYRPSPTTWTKICRACYAKWEGSPEPQYEVWYQIEMNIANERRRALIARITKNFPTLGVS